MEYNHYLSVLSINTILKVIPREGIRAGAGGLDATVGAIGLGTTALATFGLVSNPVGWGIGIGCLAYGAGCLIYDAVNEEKK